MVKEKDSELIRSPSNHPFESAFRKNCLELERLQAENDKQKAELAAVLAKKIKKEDNTSTT